MLDRDPVVLGGDQIRVLAQLGQRLLRPGS